VAAVALVASTLTATALPGCSGGPTTTLYHASDLQQASVTLRDQLASSAWLSGRTPSSPVIAILPDQLENRSNERLTPGEAWATVGRMLFDPNMQAFCRERNIQIYMPPERIPALREAGIDAPASMGQATTHFLRGTFRSATRVASLSGNGPSDLRTDTFLFDLNAIERDTGRTVWSGTYEFKRWARGKLAD
jgi:hypothetical protein